MTKRFIFPLFFLFFLLIGCINIAIRYIDFELAEEDARGLAHIELQCSEEFNYIVTAVGVVEMRGGTHTFQVFENDTVLIDRAYVYNSNAPSLAYALPGIFERTSELVKLHLPHLELNTAYSYEGTHVYEVDNVPAYSLIISGVPELLEELQVSQEKFVLEANLSDDGIGGEYGNKRIWLASLLEEAATEIPRVNFSACFDLDPSFGEIYPVSF